jgi:flavorubredoxin
MLVNSRTGTRIDEVAAGIFRVNTPVQLDGDGGGFSFNQYLILDEDPLVFHTGPRKLFPAVHEAINTVVPVEKIRYVAFSHVEADECGSLNEWLAAAPRSAPLCSALAALVSVNDIADRPARGMGNNETLSLGTRTVRWLDTPHLPHGWESGLLLDESTATLFCGDLFTQPGTQTPALTESDILESSESFRRAMDYYSHTPDTGEQLARLSDLNPTTLACMHGSAWKGDGRGLLRRLAESVC